MNTSTHRGFTLIEVGFVVALIGLLILLATNFYSHQLKLKTDDYRIDGVIQDVWSIVDAAKAWAIHNAGDWPNNPAITTPVININQLVQDGYLRKVPPTRYPNDCTNGCDDYTLTGWDRSGADATSNPSLADDLLVRFSVPGGRDGRRADMIAARIPLGHAQKASADVNDDEYQIEARIIRGGSLAGGLDYVRLLNEDRTVVFDEGDLQGVRRIAREDMQGSDRSALEGPGIGLADDELSLGVFGSSSEPRSQLKLNTDANTATNTNAVVSIGDTSGNTHELTLGMQGTSLNPYMELLAYKGGTDVPLRIEFLEASSETDNTHPAFWDIYLADRTDQPAHQSLQTRLCALEGQVTDITADVTCPVTTAENGNGDENGDEN